MQNGAIDTLVSNEETPESVPVPSNDLLQRLVKSQTSTVVYSSAAEKDRSEGFTAAAGGHYQA